MRHFLPALLLAAGLTSLQAETKLTLNKTGVAAALDTQQVTVPAGERVVLAIPVLSGNVWFKDGSPIPGANGRVLIINAARPEDSGLYRVGYLGIHSVDSQAVSLTVIGKAAPVAPRLLAFATRGIAGAGEHALTAGFIIGEGGTGSTKRVLVRAVGARNSSTL